MDTQTTVDIMKRAREVISDEGAWCRGTNAMTLSGRIVRVNDPDACRWCLGGALLLACCEKVKDDSDITLDWDAPLLHAGHDIALQMRADADYFIKRAIPGDQWAAADYMIMKWNDTRREHASVLEVLDLAIGHAEEAVGRGS